MFSVTSPATRREDEMKQEQIRTLRNKNDAGEQANFQQKQSDFARTFGRGLTDGSASRRGGAGNTTQVPPGAIPKQETYWQNEQGKPDNRVELAGMMNRGAQQFADGDKAGKDLFLKGFNDGPWSSHTDADDMKIENGGVVLYAGGEALNKPVPLEELQNITGNQLTGQNVYQREVGGGAGGGQGLMQPQSKSAVKAADVVGSAKIDKWKGVIKALDDRASVENMTPELQAEMQAAAAGYDKAVMDAGSNIYGAGLQGQQQQQGPNPEQDLLGLMDTGAANKDDVIRQRMWDKYGDKGIMRITENALAQRSQANGGLQQPGRQAPAQNTTQRQAPTEQQPKVASTEARVRSDIAKEKATSKQRNTAKSNKESDKVFKEEDTYGKLQNAVQDKSLTVKNLNKMLKDAPTMFQKKQIKTLIEQAIRLEK